MRARSLYARYGDAAQRSFRVRRRHRTEAGAFLNRRYLARRHSMFTRWLTAPVIVLAAWAGVHSGANAQAAWHQTMIAGHGLRLTSRSAERPTREMRLSGSGCGWRTRRPTRSISVAPAPRRREFLFPNLRCTKATERRRFPSHSPTPFRIQVPRQRQWLSNRGQAGTRRDTSSWRGHWSVSLWTRHGAQV